MPYLNNSILLSEGGKILQKDLRYSLFPHEAGILFFFALGLKSGNLVERINSKFSAYF